MKKIMIIAAAAGLISTAAFAETPSMMFKTVEKGQADYLGSNLVGLDVYNGANEDVGEIKDMVFNGERKLTGLVVSVGGFLGMGSKYIIVDPAAVKLAHNDSKGEWTAKIDATKEQLTSAPEFKYDGKFDD